MSWFCDHRACIYLGGRIGNVVPLCSLEVSHTQWVFGTTSAMSYFRCSKNTKTTTKLKGHHYNLVQPWLRLPTGWFKLNDGNLFPGQSPRRFFESAREILHTTSSMGVAIQSRKVPRVREFYEPLLRRPDPTFFFGWFSSVRLFGKFWPP